MVILFKGLVVCIKCASTATTLKHFCWCIRTNNVNNNSQKKNRGIVQNVDHNMLDPMMMPLKTKNIQFSIGPRKLEPSNVWQLCLKVTINE